jgi:hypothetical protein
MVTRTKKLRQQRYAAPWTPSSLFPLPSSLFRYHNAMLKFYLTELLQGSLLAGRGWRVCSTGRGRSRCSAGEGAAAARAEFAKSTAVLTGVVGKYQALAEGEGGSVGAVAYSLHCGGNTYM